MDILAITALLPIVLSMRSNTSLATRFLDGPRASNLRRQTLLVEPGFERGGGREQADRAVRLSPRRARSVSTASAMCRMGTLLVASISSYQ